MQTHQPDSIRYYTFNSLSECGVIHGAVTRMGGVSPQPWDSLNVGGTVGDDPERVLENRKRMFQVFGLLINSLYDVYQVHGTKVAFADAPRPAIVPHLRADVILTDQPGVTILMRFADCVPIFLYDPRCKVAGLVHAGWQGTLQRAAAVAVQAMHTRYGSRPVDILAGIGPSIGPHHYQVGQEVAAQVWTTFGPETAGLLHIDNGERRGSEVQFDLWNANRLILEQVGVQSIEISEICTACYLNEWYSHRGEKGRTGRFGALMALPY